MSSIPLRDRFDEDHPPAWIPETAGEFIEGTLLHIKWGPDSGYGRSPIATIQTADGPKSLWLFGEVLRGQFADIQPQPGEEILVKYLGTKMSTSGRQYKRWHVGVDRPEVEFDYSELDPSATSIKPVEAPDEDIPDDDDSDEDVPGTDGIPF